MTADMICYLCIVLLCSAKVEFGIAPSVFVLQFDFWKAQSSSIKISTVNLTLGSVTFRNGQFLKCQVLYQLLIHERTAASGSSTPYKNEKKLLTGRLYYDTV